MRELEEWGKWARGSYHLSAKSSWLLVMQGKVQMSRKVMPDITDDEALAVDKAVIRLSQQRLLAYQVVCLYYLRSMSVNKIAKVLSEHNKKRITGYLIARELSYAEGYVMAQLKST